MHWTAGFPLRYISEVTGPPPVMSVVRHTVMDAPKHIWRFPTRKAIDKLAARFGFANDPGMQDWEHEVADHTRIDEFLAAYEAGGLSDDEKFTLMETVIESFEDVARMEGDLSLDARWQRTLAVLDKNLPLHAYSVWYWSRPEAENDDEMFCVSPFIRKILATHREHFAEQLRAGDAGLRLS